MGSRCGFAVSPHMVTGGEAQDRGAGKPVPEPQPQGTAWPWPRGEASGFHEVWCHLLNGGPWPCPLG